MKQLVRKPFLLALCLSLPLWIALNNYIVAISIALVVSFTASMLESLLAIRRAQRNSARPDPGNTPLNRND